MLKIGATPSTLARCQDPHFRFSGWPWFAEARGQSLRIMVGLGLRALSINLMVVVAFCLLCPARSQEIHVVPNSPLVEALENGNFVLQEFHSDGGRIAAGRSRGKLDAAPYAAISHRRIVAADGEGGRVRVEWRVGNCEVGDSSGVYSVLFIQGSEIGTCWFPHCFAEIPETQHAQEINVFLRHADGGHDVETEVPSRMVISGVANDSDVRDTHRQQTCLPLPVTSPSGDLHITDVVFSQVHQQVPIPASLCTRSIILGTDLAHRAPSWCSSGPPAAR